MHCDGGDDDDKGVYEEKKWKTLAIILKYSLGGEQVVKKMRTKIVQTFE